MSCWHCQGTRRCACLVCALDFHEAECQACVGRELWAQLQPILEAKRVDPREPEHWVLTKTVTGGFKRHFLPLDDFKAIVKKRKETRQLGLGI